jgi:hypothetical protein
MPADAIFQSRDPPGKQWITLRLSCRYCQLRSVGPRRRVEPPLARFPAKYLSKPFLNAASTRPIQSSLRYANDNPFLASFKCWLLLG